MRINVYISSSGLCSRREADRLIENKQVKVNGKIAETGMDITSTDEVTVKGTKVTHHEEAVYLLYHKPLGIETTTDISKPDNIINAIQYPARIFPVGRLDKDSSGLIILTSDGQIVNRILRSENAHEKEYIVELASPFPDSFLEDMAGGVLIYNPVRHETTKTLPAKLKRISKTSFSIVLTQGLNLQIRRMTKALGYHVSKLHRVRIMNLDIGNLEEGKWRYFSSNELTELKKMIDRV